MINQNALENVLVDIQFLKDQFMVVGFEKFTGIFDELVMVGYIRSPIRTGILTVVCTQDREYTGKRPSCSVSRPTADEICSGETSKAANTP